MNLDFDKLSDEDKRFLIQKNTDEYIFHEQGKMNNRLFLISNFAFFISIVSLIVSLDLLSFRFLIIVIGILFFFLGVLIIMHRLSLANIKRQQKDTKSRHDDLFCRYSMNKTQ